MKLFLPCVLALSSLPVLAVAETMLDANADGVVSYDELLAVHPEVTAEMFMAADADGDALLNEEELAAAREAGLVPAEES